MIRRALWSLCLLPVACGGGASPAATSPDDASSETASPAARASQSPGAQCVAEASAPRAPIADEPTEIEVAHVLVKWHGADRADDSITRDREQACLRALEALEALHEGQSFDDVVASYSDEAGAATRGGMIGEVSREEVAPAFADAAFRLDIGQVSHVVESPFGFHVILRSR